MGEPLLPLIDAGIEALERSDRAELLRLAEAATGARAPDSAAERGLVLERMRIFGLLLALTRRNLRLLRAARPKESFDRN